MSVATAAVAAVGTVEQHMDAQGSRLSWEGMHATRPACTHLGGPWYLFQLGLCNSRQYTSYFDANCLADTRVWLPGLVAVSSNFLTHPWNDMHFWHAPFCGLRVLLLRM